VLWLLVPVYTELFAHPLVHNLLWRLCCRLCLYGWSQSSAHWSSEPEVRSALQSFERSVRKGFAAMSLNESNALTEELLNHGFLSMLDHFLAAFNFKLPAQQLKAAQVPGPPALRCVDEPLHRSVGVCFTRG
jgi:hypothetical protein